MINKNMESHIVPIPVQAPKQALIDELFAKHLEEHRHLPESARVRDLGTEKALIQDYSGRVVYELLQNALDRSDRLILVRWDPMSCCLEVANDGRPVTAYPGTIPSRSDFHALLSLHSSAKTAKESVGNKGVGFRSVFSAAEAVEVWSRTTEGLWWGMCLTHPTQMRPAVGIEWTETLAASFYSPQQLQVTRGELDAQFDGYQTVVRLRQVRPERVEVVDRSVRDLKRLPLRFLEHRAPNRTALRIAVDIRAPGQDTTPVERSIIEDPHEVAVATAKNVPVTDAVRRDTGLDLNQAEVRVLAFAPVETDAPDERRDAGLYWSYLPTEQESGFGVHIHADFYLSNSRRALSLRELAANEADAAADPAGWNRRLVRRAAELIVRDLWRRPEIFRREDFWAFASPASRRCEHLALEVGRLLLSDQGDFQQLVGLSFNPEYGPWTLQRYVDFFTALEAWAAYAYQYAGRAGWPRRFAHLYQWRQELLAMVEKSGATVLPIVGRCGDDAMDQPVEIARPLVQGKSGSPRGERERIYRRGTAGASSIAISLPPAILQQGTYVTAFTPPGASDNELGKHGLLDFSRPEILAQLRPGANDGEHQELLLAAVRIANEGRDESIMARALAFEAGPAWRLLANLASKDTPLGRAARSLSNLFVPTTDFGWQPARTVARAKGGPWPRLDEFKLAAILQEGIDESSPAPTLDETCLLFGIAVVPIDDETQSIPHFPEQPSAELARQLLVAWERDLHPIFRASGAVAPLVAKAREQLQQGQWIHKELFDDQQLWGGKIEADVGFGTHFAPLDLWWQGAQGGFRTRLLPRLVISRGDELPGWAEDMGLENPLYATSPERIRRAVERLRHSGPKDERDLLDLYRSLVDGALRQDPPMQIPLLYRRMDNGRSGGLEWGTAADHVWHDPGGAASSALSAFRDVRIWVYRNASEKAAKALGTIHFVPIALPIRYHGESKPELASELRQALWDALPDLLAAAAMARDPFDQERAIGLQANLKVLHYEKVWIEWTFEGKTATRGQEEAGDVFLYPVDGTPALWFDGNELPLVECAYPLSELLCENRAFGALFRDGLYAWSRTGDAGEAAASVVRFRRDHNLAESDVAQWRARLQDVRLNPERRQVWLDQVTKVLSQYGDVAPNLKPGMKITPRTWTKVHADVSEADMQCELAAAFSSPDFQPLVPIVDFRTVHRQDFQETPRRQYIAAAADLRECANWSESLLEELTATGEGISPEEEEQFHSLTFNADAAWRKRYKLSTEGTLAPSREAQLFADGHIPLDHLPIAAARVTLQPFNCTPSGVLRPAITDLEELLRSSRRKAVGGRRAESAVLDLAVPQAIQWLTDDPEGFKKALKPVLTLLDRGDPADLMSSEAMRQFLHVADKFSNLGFDVLVPYQKQEQFLMVEVKRVGALDGNAVFFLSENERQKAREYRQKGLHWRLWLVSSGRGAPVDVSSIVDRFDQHQGEVDALLVDGLRPGKWMLVAEVDRN
jgi:hypothetical protein